LRVLERRVNPFAPKLASLSDDADDPGRRTGRIFSYDAFPHTDHEVAVGLKDALCSLFPLLYLGELRGPCVGVGTRRSFSTTILAPVTVPKTPVYIDRDSMSREHDVCGQLAADPAVNSEPEPSLVEGTTEQQLRYRITRPAP